MSDRPSYLRIFRFHLAHSRATARPGRLNLVGSFLVVPKENLIWEVSHRPGTELDFDSGDRERGDRQPGDFRTTNFAPSQLASLATSITTALPPTGSSPTVT